MNLRRLWFLLVLVVSSASVAGCAHSGAGGGGYAGAGAFADCYSVYPPGSPYAYSPYGNGPGYYEDGLCATYPRLYDGSFEGAVSVPLAPRATTSAQHREHRAREVTRPDGSDWGRSSGSDSSSSSAGSSVPAAPVIPPAPRMEPAPVSVPAPAPVAIQPRSSN